MAGGKRSPYKYRPTLPSEIGKCDSLHSVAGAAQGLSRNLEEQLVMDTFNPFQDVYVGCYAQR